MFFKKNRKESQPIMEMNARNGVSAQPFPANEQYFDEGYGDTQYPYLPDPISSDSLDVYLNTPYRLRRIPPPFTNHGGVLRSSAFNRQDLARQIINSDPRMQFPSDELELINAMLGAVDRLLYIVDGHVAGDPASNMNDNPRLSVRDIIQDIRNRTAILKATLLNNMR